MEQERSCTCYFLKESESKDNDLMHTAAEFSDLTKKRSAKRRTGKVNDL